MQFLFAKTFADLSDTHGRKPFLLVACMAILLYGLFFAMANSMYLILFGYTLEGIFAVGFSSGQAYMADITTTSAGKATPNRAVSMAAYYGVTQGLTSVVGVLAALIAMEGFGWSAQQTFWLIVGCALVEVPWLMLMVPESLPVAKRVPFDKAK